MENAQQIRARAGGNGPGPPRENAQPPKPTACHGSPRRIDETLSYQLTSDNSRSVVHVLTARAPEAIRGSLFVQRDAGADPRLIDVEIDAHHFALAHSDKIVHKGGIAVLVRPDKHHSDFGF